MKDEEERLRRKGRSQRGPGGGAPPKLPKVCPDLKKKIKL